MFAYLFGLAPFLKLNWHVASLGFITKMNLDDLIEKSHKADTWNKKFDLRAYILVCGALNYFGDGLLENLNKRGIHTCYWVLNDNEEILKLRNRSNV